MLASHDAQDPVLAQQLTEPLLGGPYLDTCFLRKLGSGYPLLTSGQP